MIFVVLRLLLDHHLVWARERRAVSHSLKQLREAELRFLHPLNRRMLTAAMRTASFATAAAIVGHAAGRRHQDLALTTLAVRLFKLRVAYEFVPAPLRHIGKATYDDRVAPLNMGHELISCHAEMALLRVRLEDSHPMLILGLLPQRSERRR